MLAVQSVSLLRLEFRLSFLQKDGDDDVDDDEDGDWAAFCSNCS